MALVCSVYRNGKCHYHNCYHSHPHRKRFTCKGYCDAFRGKGPCVKVKK